MGVSCGEDSDESGSGEDCINSSQCQQLINELKGFENLHPIICQKANIANLTHLRSADFDKVMEWIKKQKQCAPHQASR